MTVERAFLSYKIFGYAVKKQAHTGRKDIKALAKVHVFLTKRTLRKRKKKLTFYFSVEASLRRRILLYYKKLLI